MHEILRRRRLDYAEFTRQLRGKSTFVSLKYLTSHLTMWRYYTKSRNERRTTPYRRRLVHAIPPKLHTNMEATPPPLSRKPYLTIGDLPERFAHTTSPASHRRPD